MVLVKKKKALFLSFLSCSSLELSLEQSQEKRWRGGLAAESEPPRRKVRGERKKGHKSATLKCRHCVPLAALAWKAQNSDVQGLGQGRQNWHVNLLNQAESLRGSETIAFCWIEKSCSSAKQIGHRVVDSLGSITSSSATTTGDFALNIE